MDVTWGIKSKFKAGPKPERCSPKHILGLHDHIMIEFWENRVMLPLPYLGELCFEIQHFAIKPAASPHLPSDTQAVSGNRAVFLGQSG